MSRTFVTSRKKGRIGLAFAVGLTAMGLGFGAFAYRMSGARGSNAATTRETAHHDESPLAAISNDVTRALRLSRPVLLGSRDPHGASCVSVVQSGAIIDTPPTNAGDLNGGPGTTFATLYGIDRQAVKSPIEDFNWHQNRLRRFLENLQASNDPALQAATDLSESVEALRTQLSSSDVFPTQLKATGFSDRTNWASYCLTELDAAIAKKDLITARHWAGELAGAALSLEDLHRWLGFLSADYLAALDFQLKCQTLYDQAEALKKPYQSNSTVSNFPAGVLCLNGFGNFYEVERQGERLFSMPPDRVDEIATNEHLTDASLWVTPAVRKTFLKLQSALSDDNQKTFAAAARTPFEHSYLINMLYRATAATSTDDLVAVLKKFDALHAKATVGELMGVLMYRGHSFAGLEWSDRYQPALLDAASKISPGTSDADALLQATQWTNNFYRTPASSYGVTFTLRDALEQKRLDCVRATDMIGAIFRNAGRPRFANVRWVGATCGHSLAAYLQPNGDNLNIVLGDGLRQNDALEKWPDCYFNDHPWPPGFEQEAPPYAAELYTRGIDSYIFAEGYIIRGPNAGTLKKVGIPYVPRHNKASEEKVFAGPYPK